MIQAADVGAFFPFSFLRSLLISGAGVGIVGKEGRQASLAADFSITQFSYLTKLLVWHGRNSYKRSAKLAQFVIHRGLIISVIQGPSFLLSSHLLDANKLLQPSSPPSSTCAFLSLLASRQELIPRSSPIAIYQGWLMVGYATAYTMLPVFSLVLDRDVNEDVALLYPELYKELTKVRSAPFPPFCSC